jgi:hypothetical protein
LKIVSYKDLYDWTMDDIVEAIGLKSNCTFCGVFRRQVFWNTNQSNENINVIGKLNNKIKLLFVRFLKCPAELKKQRKCRDKLVSNAKVFCYSTIEYDSANFLFYLNSQENFKKVLLCSNVLINQLKLQ